MAKHKLTTAFVLKTKKIRRHADGDGLSLQVTAGAGETINKSWIVRYRSPNGKWREMGLGKLQYVDLAEARDKAEEARKLARKGNDPLEAQAESNRKKEAEKASRITFEEIAERYIALNMEGWKHAKHRQQWVNTLANHVYPVFGNVAVSEVEKSLVLRALDPLWEKTAVTAHRLRGRIERILDYATGRGYRSGENPARWRRIMSALPDRTIKALKKKSVKHHAALSYSELPEFIQVLQPREGMAALALAFLILTATRTTETREAKWQEIDIADKVWTIPKERMKSTEEHRVPLSREAMAILQVLRGISGDSVWIFPSPQTTKPLSNMAMLTLLKRLRTDKITVHGFRSTFRDWAAEQTNYPREVAEAALAHKLRDKVEAAYRRGDLLEKRRPLMDDWGRYCGGITANPSIVLKEAEIRL